MKSWLITFLLLSMSLPGWRWLTQVREHNNAQAQGQAAAKLGRPAEAVYYYQQAVALAGRRGPTPALLLDLAQAQTQVSQAGAARATYSRLLGPAVPVAIGSTARQQLALLLARQQQVAQAINLLRQALKLNPANATARYNYELLSQYLATQQPDNPLLPPPAQPASPNQPKQPGGPDSTAAGSQGKSKSPATKTGENHPGEAPNPAQPPSGDEAAPRPSTTGQPDPQHPTPQTGNNAAGGFKPGTGKERPLPSGSTPGRQRGLDPSASATGEAAPAGRGQRPGSEAATNSDLQLQTQRERLKAMNLTPTQARQLLDALRESEQQYLQQRPRPQQGAAPDPNKPTW